MAILSKVIQLKKFNIGRQYELEEISNEIEHLPAGNRTLIGIIFAYH